MSVTRIDLGVKTAKKYVESFSDGLSNTYLAFAKVDSWANDAAPDTANVSHILVRDIWRNMLGAKKITGSDVRSVIPRYNWTANTIYEIYDDTDEALFSANNDFYVLTSENRIYKCLNNNGRSNSTVEPSSTATNTTSQTADGYLWKFMYELTASQILRFTTDDYIPCRTLEAEDTSFQWLIQQSATRGSLSAIVVEDEGSGYSNVNNLEISIAGDGSSASATANINTVSNTVSSVTITDPGQDYTNVIVTVSGGGGTGATARAIISPYEGHGSNPAYELGAKYVLMNPRIAGSESDRLLTTNQMRQIAIVEEPIKYGTSNVQSNTAVSQYTTLTLSGSGVDYDADELVYQGSSLNTSSFFARVVEFDSSNNKLHVIATEGSVSVDTIIGANSTASRFVNSVENPEMIKNTGQMLYIDNIEPITRDPDQTEDFKIVVEF